MRKTKALIHLRGVSEEATTLKRLALLFDEVRIVPPQAYSFTMEALQDPRIITRRADRSFTVSEEFNFFSHIGREWKRQLTRKEDPELFDVIECFQNEGILIEAEDDYAKNDEPLHKVAEFIRMSLIENALGDPTFERLSETTASQYDLPKRTHVVQFAPIEGETEPLAVPFVTPPNLISDLDEIITSLLVAEQKKMSAIFQLPRHRQELSFIYEQFKISKKSLEAQYPELKHLSDYKLIFGEIAFSIFNEVVASSSFESMSPTKILKLRNALEEARVNFLSEGLGELLQLASDNPWSAATALELENFINGKLRHQIADYDKQSSAAWKKMYGRLTVHAVTAARDAMFGSASVGASAMAGLVAPGTSMWGMMVMAALGVAKETPKIVDTIYEGFQEANKHEGSSISFLAKTSKLK